MSYDGLAPDFFKKTRLRVMHKALSEGTVSSVDLVKHALHCIDQQHDLNAFFFVDATGALQQAALLDEEIKKGAMRGPLHGIPVAIKDNIFTKDQVTSMGSGLFEKYMPQTDAHCVHLLREAGAIIIGKTATHEFAYGPTGDCSFFGATKNPVNPAKMTGGSSSGSAAAVASGMVPVALGTDTGGSVRIPSALCGVSGFKPSFGSISTEGVYPLSGSLDTVGIIANASEDVQDVFDVLASNIKDHSLPSSKLKLGWFDPDGFITCDKALKDKVKTVADILPYVVVALDVSGIEGLRQADMLSRYGRIQGSEAFAIHADNVKEHSDKFQPEVLDRLKVAELTRGWEYIQALQSREPLGKAYAKLFEVCDVIIMPTLPITAPDLYTRSLDVNGKTMQVRELLLSFTCPWSVLGYPSYTLRCALLDRLPVGLQLIAPKGKDVYLLDVAQAVEHFFETASNDVLK